MRKIVLTLSCCLWIGSTPSLASPYVLAPPTTAVKIDADTEILKKISDSLAKIAEASKKALVFISVSKTTRGQQTVDPFEFFFGGDGGRQAPMPSQRQEGFGSGFFVDLDKGYILTNNHVVENADKITLKLADGKTYDGKIVGNDRDTDVAVVQVIDSKFSRNALTALVLDDSDKTSIGSFAVALGAPFLLETSITFGIVSATGRGNLSLTKMGNFIQTDAAINPGNSGGPLVNMDGKVIGINSAIYSQSGAYAGVGFSIPSNIARRIATSLINGGSFQKGYIGIAYEPLREEWLASLDLPKRTKGIIIGEVAPDGPAAQAKLEANDVVVAVDGQDLSPENLSSLIGLKDPGTKVMLTIYRRGKKMDMPVVIGTSPVVAANKGAAAKKAASPVSNKAYELFGFELTPVDQKLQGQFGFMSKSGLVITQLEPTSPAWRANLRIGDVVLSVNGHRITSLRDFENARRDRKTILIQVESKGRVGQVLLDGASS